MHSTARVVVPLPHLYHDEVEPANLPRLASELAASLGLLVERCGTVGGSQIPLYTFFTDARWLYIDSL